MSVSDAFSFRYGVKEWVERFLEEENGDVFEAFNIKDVYYNDDDIDDQIIVFEDGSKFSVLLLDELKNRET